MHVNIVVAAQCRGNIYGTFYLAEGLVDKFDVGTMIRRSVQQQQLCTGSSRLVGFNRYARNMSNFIMVRSQFLFCFKNTVEFEKLHCRDVEFVVWRPFHKASIASTYHVLDSMLLF